ncbi:YdcF family protein [bacterium]|nr:MAG: YdcF family protein [bacterium]
MLSSVKIEIEREPEVPNLTENEIEEITQIVFVEPNPQKADLIFIFGYGPGHTEAQWESVAKLFKDGYANKILVNGLFALDQKAEIPFSHSIRDSLVKNGVPKENILVQDKSKNTLEDVIMGKELLESEKIFPQTMLYVSKAHHAGRCYLTLKKCFPNIKLFPFAFDAVYNGIVVSKKDWWKFPVARARVWGEYLRIKKYSERGDISTPSQSPPYQGGEKER